MPTLQEVDDYAVPDLLIPRIMKLYNRDEEYAKGIVKEAKRMLYLHWVTKHPVCPSIQIDDAWHEMILFTRWYAKFCDFIGGFVHHTPEPVAPKAVAPKQESAPSAPSEAETLYDQTRANYEEHFGEKPNTRYWTE